MITTRMFADTLGITLEQARALARGHRIGGEKVGRTVFLDIDDLRRYADEVLPAQIEQLKQKEIWREKLTELLDEVEENAAEPSDYMTVLETSEALGMTVPPVLKKLRAGKLEGRQIGGIWFVKRDSVEKALEDAALEAEADVAHAADEAATCGTAPEQ